MEKRKIKVGITHGDVNGIGYEIIFKLFSEPTMFELCTPILYGSPKIATYHRKALDLNVNVNVINTVAEAVDDRLNLLVCSDEDVKIDFGMSTPESGKAALVALEKAVENYGQGIIDVLVTAPINKFSIQSDAFHFPGHTEYIQERLGAGAEALMILMNDNIRVALATTHLPLKDVSAAITPDLLERKLRILHHSLVQDFNISNPRIAVLALNAHAGEQGLLGTEEQEIIAPTIAELSQQGIPCFGPYAADGFFGSQMYSKFDAILAMYHDQGLAPFKALAMSNGVNFTAGLPVVRTSPDHGTAYDIAGKGVADENSLRQAVYTAIDIYRNRVHYLEAHTNPLRRQYYEKRDDSDKLRLNQD